MTTTATTTAVTKGNKVSSTTEQAKAIIAKANAKKEATAPLLNSNDVRMSNKEIIDQEIAKEQAKAKDAKATSKRTAGTMFTRSEAMGIVMKANPKATAEVLINKADSLYISKTGHESNKKEQTTQYGKCVNFLKGYNAK